MTKENSRDPLQPVNFNTAFLEHAKNQKSMDPREKFRLGRKQSSERIGKENESEGKEEEHVSRASLSPMGSIHSEAQPEPGVCTLQAKFDLLCASDAETSTPQPVTTQAAKLAFCASGSTVPSALISANRIASVREEKEDTESSDAKKNLAVELNQVGSLLPAAVSDFTTTEADQTVNHDPVSREEQKKDDVEEKENNSSPDRLALQEQQLQSPVVLTPEIPPASLSPSHSPARPDTSLNSPHSPAGSVSLTPSSATTISSPSTLIADASALSSSATAAQSPIVAPESSTSSSTSSSDSSSSAPSTPVLPSSSSSSRSSAPPPLALPISSPSVASSALSLPATPPPGSLSASLRIPLNPPPQEDPAKQNNDECLTTFINTAEIKALPVGNQQMIKTYAENIIADKNLLLDHIGDAAQSQIIQKRIYRNANAINSLLIFNRPAELAFKCFLGALFGATLGLAFGLIVATSGTAVGTALLSVIVAKKLCMTAASLGAVISVCILQGAAYKGNYFLFKPIQAQVDFEKNIKTKNDFRV